MAFSSSTVVGWLGLLLRNWLAARLLVSAVLYSLVLQKLPFSHAASDANCIDFIGNQESMRQSSPFPEDARSDIRSIAASQLRNIYPGHPTTIEEKRAITSLKNDPNITNLRVGKGGATVIMEKADYKEKASLGEDMPCEDALACFSRLCRGVAALSVANPHSFTRFG